MRTSVFQRHDEGGKAASPSLEAGRCQSCDYCVAQAAMTCWKQPIWPRPRLQMGVDSPPGCVCVDQASKDTADSLSAGWSSTTHTRTLTHAHSHTLTHTRTLTHAHTLAHTRTLTHAHTHTHTRSLTRTLTHAHSHTLTHTRSLTHARSHAHSHTHTLARTRTLTHAHTHTHTCSLTHAHSHTLAHTHTHTRTLHHGSFVGSDAGSTNHPAAGTDDSLTTWRLHPARAPQSSWMLMSTPTPVVWLQGGEGKGKD